MEKLARSVAKEEKIRVKLIFSTHLLERISQVASTWGPATLLAALKTDAYWRDESLPSRARIVADHFHVI